MLDLVLVRLPGPEELSRYCYEITKVISTLTLFLAWFGVRLALPHTDVESTMAAGSVFVHRRKSGPLRHWRLSFHSDQSTRKFAACNRNLTRSAVSLFSTCSLLTLILTATTQVCFAQRGSQQQPQGPEDRGATISVNLRVADHSPVEEGVIVNLRAF